MTFGEIVRDETRTMFAGRFPIVLLLFIGPLLFTIIFGFIYHENVVNDVPMVVLDQEQSSLSRMIVEAYNDSEKYDIVAYAATQEEAEADLYDGKALVALEIPKDFSKQIKTGNGSNLLFVANSTNNMFANGAMSAAQEINRSISVAIGTKTMESAGLLPGSAMAAAYPVRMGVRILNNPANGYGPFMLSGLMANGAQIGLMVAFAPVIVTEIKRRRCGKKVPVPFMFLAKFLPYWFFGMIAFMLSLLFIVYGFDVPMLGHWQDLLLLGLGYYFFVGCILMLFSACAPSRPLSLQAPMLYIMPGLLYSGLSWPPFDMSTFAWYFSRLLPITYIGDNMRDVLLMGHAPGLGSALQAMSIGGCIAAALAVIAFKFRIWLQDRKGVEDHGKDAADTSA